MQVDSEGNVRYDAIARQGQRADKVIQSQFKDLVPLAHRKDLTDEQRAMERPSEDDVQATTDKTRAALEKLVNGKIKAAQPKNVPDSQGKTAFIRYTPGQQNGAGLKQRIIKMTEVVEDPLEPPRFKHKKIPRGPPSPPPPVLRSPPRKATAQEQKEWMIPPCISNWKNNKGFTIPLDKRLAADGRGLQDVSFQSKSHIPANCVLFLRCISMINLQNFQNRCSSPTDTRARKSGSVPSCSKSLRKRRKPRKRKRYDCWLSVRARSGQVLHPHDQQLKVKLQ